MYVWAVAECRRGNCSGKAPQGFCKHRLAANLYHKAVAMSTQSEAPIAQASASLPEAPASVNVRVMIAGREVMLTLRDTDEQALLVRLTGLLAQFPVSAAPNGSLDEPEKTCPLHHQQMKQRQGKYGIFYSHKTAQGWCKGR